MQKPKPRPPRDISWGWLLFGIAALILVAPVYAVQRLIKS